MRIVSGVGCGLKALESAVRAGVPDAGPRMLLIQSRRPPRVIQSLSFTAHTSWRFFATYCDFCKFKLHVTKYRELHCENEAVTDCPYLMCPHSRHGPQGKGEWYFLLFEFIYILSSSLIVSTFKLFIAVLEKTVLTIYVSS